MARYFFNVVDGQIINDSEGSELADLAAVREEALRTTGELLRGGSHADLWSGEQWSMHVKDEAGADILTLRFSAEQH